MPVTKELVRTFEFECSQTSSAYRCERKDRTRLDQQTAPKESQVEARIRKPETSRHVSPSRPPTGDQ
jgi:hypothetical protein